MHFIDTHTHIYLPEFDDDRREMMERAGESGIRTILLPAIDSTTHASMMALEKQFEGCHAMIGLHPCSVNQDYEKELQVIDDLLARRKFIAIGEIGLDFYWDKTFTKQQYDAFHKQIDTALAHDLPIAIHSRNAIDECIEVVEQYSKLRGVFHCFSGDLQQAQRIIQTGFFLGIGGVLTFKNAGLDKVIPHTGLSHVILETDAPYLAPVPYRGKRNEPAYIRIVAEKLALVCDLDVAEIAGITTANAKRLFSL